MYGDAKDNNIGVLQGSAISAFLSIIYRGDMMEDLEALNRCTILPMRVIQDRPHEPNRKPIRGDIKKRGGGSLRGSPENAHNQK